MERVDVASLSRFVAIAEHQSFRAAARALYIAQPTLTKQMQQLEASLGTTLFERGRWGVRLTKQGEALLIRARAILDDITNLPSIIGTPQELVRVGAAETAVGSFLAPFLGHWIAKHPEVHIKLIGDGLSGLLPRLRARECDVALLASPVPPEFEYFPIKQVQVQAVLPQAHQLAGTDEPLPVTELADLPILLNGDAYMSTQLVQAACKLTGVRLTEVYNSPIGQTLASLVENGLGVAVLADSVDLRAYDVRCRSLVLPSAEPLQFTINVAYQRTLYVPPGLAHFIGDLASFVGTESE